MIYEDLKLNLQSTEPIYRQLVSGFERFSRKHPPLTPIPPERELSAALGISRTALRQALAECRERGILIQQWGKGIFTADAQKKVLVLMPGSRDIAGPWHYILPGIEERGRELSVIVETVSQLFLRNQSPEEIRQVLLAGEYAGIIALDYQAWEEAPDYQALLSLGVPVLYPHTGKEWSALIPFAAGMVDEAAAFREACALLVRAGHRAIATLGGAEMRGYSGDSLREMLIACGADPQRSLHLLCDYSPSEIDRAIDALVQSPERPTALMCFSDFFAIMAIAALKRNGVNVPTEISVMGFCGYPGGEFMTPRLSTIDFQYHRIGREALDRVLTLPGNPQEIPAEERVCATPCIPVWRNSVMEPELIKKEER